VCAPRWAEALEAGVAPQVVLAATHARTLDWCDLTDLKRHAIDTIDETDDTDDTD
jgi:uncharacterized protein (DUF2237 family)